MTVQLSPLVHIELTVHNAEKASQFLQDAFGAEKVQEEFANFLDGENARVIHVGLGDVVLQFIQPKTENGSWYEQLQQKGPGVHNLTYVVDSMDETLKALAEEDVTPLFSFPLNWEELLGAENVKPDPQPVYMINSMEKIGFHLELAESPAKELAIEPVASVPVDPIGRVSPMLHIELTTADAAETYRLLHKVFGSEKVELKFANFLDSAFMKVVHVNLGDVVLQYCQPLMESGSWYEQLKANGPGVHNITFLVENMEDTMKAINQAGAEDLFAFPLDWSELLGAGTVRSDVPPVHMVNTMEILGFHLELSERPAEHLADLLFKEF